MGWRDVAGGIQVDGRRHGDTPGMVCPFSHSVSAHSFASQHVKKHTTPSRLPELIFGLKLGALIRLFLSSIPQDSTSNDHFKNFCFVSSNVVDSDFSLARCIVAPQARQDSAKTRA